MKKKILSATLLFALSFTFCSKESNGFKEIDVENSKSNENVVISIEKLLKFTNEAILDYENTGVNFYIEKDESFFMRSANNDTSETRLILKTELTNKEIVETSLLYKFEDNGDVEITHYSENLILATIYINSSGKVYKIDLPNDETKTRSLKSWYDCVNKEYQKNKQTVESDMLNDIACTVFSVPCAVLNAASAIGKC